MAAPYFGSEQYVKTFFTTEAIETRPTGWVIALHTANPNLGDDNKVVGGTYMDQPVTFASESKGFYCEAQSNIDVTFPAAGVGQSYTVSYYTVRDSTTGACLAIAALPVPIPVVEGGIVSFPSSYIKVRGV